LDQYKIYKKNSKKVFKRVLGSSELPELRVENKPNAVLEPNDPEPNMYWIIRLKCVPKPLRVLGI
jgi:hypothetical protein